MAAEAPKLFFTPDEAGALLNLHPATVRRKCLAGELRYERSSSGKMSHIRVLAIDVYRMAGRDMPQQAEGLPPEAAKLFQDVLEASTSLLRAVARLEAICQPLMNSGEHEKS